MPSGNPSGSGSGDGAAAAAELPGARDFSLANHYAHTAGERRGNAAGFSSFVLVRPFAVPTGFELLYNNYRNLFTSGGWYLAVDSNAWRVGVARQSDGTIVASGGVDPVEALATYLVAGFIDRLFLLTLTYDGTSARLYVNGILARTLVPTGGYQVADVTYQARLGANGNVGGPDPSTSMAILGHGYIESLVSAADVLQHYRDTLAADAFVAGPFAAGTAAPINEDGTTTGFTDTGAPLVIESKIARW